MKTLLHILAGMDRGGCEGNAICLIRASPEVSHDTLVLGEVGAMSEEFSGVCASLEHAGVLGCGQKKVIGSVTGAAERSEADGVIVWHGMVALPEILHALRDFRGEILVHGGNPAHSMRRSVDLRYLLREKWLGRRASATYVCCSRHVADSFEGSVYLRRFPRVVVPNGTLPRESAIINPVTGRTDGNFILGMTARLDGIKDHATLLRSFAAVLNDFPNARLELAGEGELHGELNTLAGNLGISDRVRFLGTVSDVSSVLRNWDLFVYATTDREGFGNALIEAMMFGLPCIATDTGPIREVTGHLSVEHLVPPGDADSLAKRIVILLRDSDARTRLANEGRIRAEGNFSPEVFARAYLNALRIGEQANP